MAITISNDNVDKYNGKLCYAYATFGKYQKNGDGFAPLGNAAKNFNICGEGRQGGSCAVGGALELATCKKGTDNRKDEMK